MRRTVSLWLPVALWAAVVFAFSAVPSLSTGLGLWDEILRKGAHIAEYAVLAVLLRRALSAEVPALALAVVYAGSDELHQSFVRGRVGSPVDVAIDGVGASIGLLVLLRARRLRAAL